MKYNIISALNSKGLLQSNYVSAILKGVDFEFGKISVFDSRDEVTFFKKDSKYELQVTEPYTYDQTFSGTQIKKGKNDEIYIGLSSENGDKYTGVKRVGTAQDDKFLGGRYVTDDGIYFMEVVANMDKFKPEGWGVYEGPGRSFFTGAVMKLSFYDKETCDAYMKFVIEEETRRKNDIDPSEFTLNNTIREEHQLSNLFDPTAMEVMPVGEFDKFANRIMKSPMEVINYYIDPNQTERRGQKK